MSNIPAQYTSKFVSPNIRSSKRRVVKAEDRKRALFSCDRCKVRKIACQRISDDSNLKHDTKTACVQCKKSNLECTTTIKRKKRVHGPIENIGLHYKCLLTIVGGLYPDKDVNNIDVLIELGTSLNLKMPSRDGISKEEENSLKDIAILLTSNNNNDENNATEKRSQIQNIATGAGTQRQANTMDKVIVDHRGNSHYIGPLGAPAFLGTIFNIIVKTSNDKNALSLTHFRKKPRNDNIISSAQEPLSPNVLKHIDLRKFPLVNLLNKKEADIYVDTFFSKLHDIFYCFDETKFRSNYEIFWNLINIDTDNNQNSLIVKTDQLSNSEICCIYIVWILGKLYNDPNSNGKLDEALINRYINIIKLVLSEIVLTPTLDGIRCMLLLSLYMDSQRRRESGYILLELATRQAISLGLHRQSLVNITANNVKVEEMKRTWWTLFQQELRFSNQMGRSSCIQIEDINVEYPSIIGYNTSNKVKIEEYSDEEKLSVHRRYYIQYCELSKLAFELLEYRKTLYLNNELLSLTNMEKVLTIKRKFYNWYVNLDQDLKNYKLEPVSKLKLTLLLQYHYYYISLSLPFLLYLITHSNLILKNDDPLLDFICQCMNSSIEIAKILAFEDQMQFFNGTLCNDLFIGYHATMVLVVSYILLLTNSKSVDVDFINTKYQVNFNTLLESVNLINIMKQRNVDKIKGSLKAISDIIDILINDLNFLIRSYEKNSRNENNEYPQNNKEASNINLLINATKLNSSPIPGDFNKKDGKINKSFVSSVNNFSNTITHSPAELDYNIAGNENNNHQYTTCASDQQQQQQQQQQPLYGLPQHSLQPHQEHKIGNSQFASTDQQPVNITPASIDYSFDNSMLFDTELIDLLFGNDLFNNNVYRNMD
ncbi:hypothetical protein PACTADRAFT_69133 [Pachysolen tannophilus NRRL Y-2460]|uniref:Zn(2)-C6 fungal-type domain-containing protein n=1 Tax=Pachysolen tannophilus NRRL Y-2460 TaxID=669874 RepID=A0A1E4TV93_PACTA|nr:hypothetical protein PACTADRAFT_69133 [Pachysolen tannophilus NRRL Y-2460]